MHRWEMETELDIHEGLYRQIEMENRGMTQGYQGTPRMHRGKLKLGNTKKHLEFQGQGKYEQHYSRSTWKTAMTM